MKAKIILIMTLSLLYLIGCKKASTESVDKNIVSETNTVKFREIVLLLSIKSTDTTYIVTDRIEQIQIKINDNIWGKFSSKIIDTTAIIKEIGNNYFESKTKTSYLIIAECTPDYGSFTTAGQYSSYLNSFLELEPGDYVCKIEELQLKGLNSQTATIKTSIFKNFTVLANTRSSFIGEIELKIY